MTQARGDSSDSEGSNAIKGMSNIRTKFAKNVIIGHLNINSIANKIDAIGETKLDDTFPNNQFVISGFKK